jgi:putative transposase
MVVKILKKYRIPSSRLQNWNYGWNAAYFVTICTQHRECYFGNIIETQNFASPHESPHEIKLSDIGKIAHQYWNEIPNHFPFVELGEFVVMPNHVHGIIIINKNNDENGDEIEETQNFASPQKHPPQQPQQNKFGPQSKNLASIIRGYKSGVKKYATMNHINFAWQSRFHDHIIRNDESFQRISEYIVNNPLNWSGDNYLQ